MGKEPLLKVENLTVEVGGKEVLKDFSLEVGNGEKHVLLGPNGSGKTTFILTLLGFSGYKVRKGSIIFKGKDITNLPVNERVKLGMGMAFQRPPSIRGVKLRSILSVMKKGPTKELVDELNLRDFLDRDLNLGFSGGEIKRSEVLQLLAQKPDLVLLDEPDSGVDVENIQLIGNRIAGLIKNRAAIIITHMGHILEYVHADIGHVILGGKIVCSGKPRELIANIRKHGYEACVRCRRRRQ